MSINGSAHVDGQIASVNPTHLRYFVAAAEEGQISRAAKKLFIAQPALSQAISKLERQLGLELLRRHPRGVTLTPAGVIIFERAREATLAETQALATVRSLTRERQHRLDLGFLSNPPPMLTPRALAVFQAIHPDAQISFRELCFPVRSVSAWLADVDLALCYAPPAHPALESHTLWLEPRVLLVHRTNALAAATDVSVADVLTETFCGEHPDTDPRWASVWTLDDHRGRRPRHVTDDRPTNALETIAGIASGGGVRAFPASIAEMLASFVKDVVAVPLLDAAPVPCALAWLTPPVNSLTLAFVDAVRASIAGDERPGALAAT